MRASLRALLSGLIDYAGLFPPAKLPMREAVENYLRYRKGSEAWMLGRFVCPAARLQELGQRDLPCSALARGGEKAEEVLVGLEEDLRDIHRAGERVEVLEVKTSPPMVGMVAERAASLGLRLFFEVPVSAVGQLPAGVGFKFRAGGLDASGFPSARQVAQALHTCHRHGVPFKATAGLHHPLPRWDAGIQVRMHGFVNLFVAGVLLYVHGTDEATLVHILEEEDPKKFSFEEEGFRWGDLWVTTDEIARARREAVLSFGSCSFEEPCEDLRALGWLGGEG